MMAQAQTSDGNLPPEREVALKKMVATNLIGQELLEKEASTLKIKVAATEIDSLLDQFKRNFPDEATFQAELKKAGNSEKSLREKLGKQIRADKVMSASVEKMVTPSDEEIAKFFKEHRSEFGVHDSLRALQIVLLKDPKKASKTAEDKKKLEELRKRLEADSLPIPLMIRAFMETAAQFSEGPEAKTGGDLGRFHPRDFHPDFRKSVQPLTVGSLSPIFQTPLGTHLVLLLEKFDGKMESYRLVILQNIAAEKARKTGESLRTLLQGLAKKYPVKFLDKSYEDTSAAGVYRTL
jgi:parvulin-like peptidyl-prolyl isomerase